MKQKLSQNETANNNNPVNSIISPPLSPNTSFPQEDISKRPKSESKHKIKSPTKISLFNPNKGKVKGKTTTNTTYFSSSPKKNIEVLSSGQNSVILSSGKNSKNNLCSEVIFNETPKHGPVQFDAANNKLLCMNINYNNYTNVIKDEIYFSEDEKKLNVISSGFLSQENEGINSQVGNKGGFIKNKYKMLLDNYNKLNVSSNPV